MAAAVPRVAHLRRSHIINSNMPEQKCSLQDVQEARSQQGQSRCIKTIYASCGVNTFYKAGPDWPRSTSFVPQKPSLPSKPVKPVSRKIGKYGFFSMVEHQFQAEVRRPSMQ